MTLENLKYRSAILRFATFLLLITLARISLRAQPDEVHSVLILFEGRDAPARYGEGDARELAMLLGHFPEVQYKLEAVEAYSSGEIGKFDLTFFVGFSKFCRPPDRFLRDVASDEKQFVWLNTGIDQFNRNFDLEKLYGFHFEGFDSVSTFDEVTSGKTTFTKGEPNLNLIAVSPGQGAEILATARSSSTRREFPYIIRHDKFMYVADSPFASATETDRYILFADMLHDILRRPHEEIHRALVRIEDVDVFEHPDRLREIADIMSSRHVPFLVGIIPYFVDPDAGIRVSLSDKPEFVDAIHYMVAHGATIVMHGVTHQYQGVTASDFEFWDGSMDRPIRNDSREYVEKKIRMGLEECWKNNIFPLVWETPHYTASQIDYPVFREFFSTAMEQKLVLDDPDYSQYFPYIIEKDIYGQRVIPENLGYIPLDSSADREEEAVQHLLKGAEAQLHVRDGFASAFIHPFIDPKYIAEYVDGVLALGYTFMDLKLEPATVLVKDRAVVTGDETYTIRLEDQYVRETWLKPNGEIERWEISADRIHDTLTRHVIVPPGQIYLAEASEYRETHLTLMERIQTTIKEYWDGLFPEEESFEEPRIAILWDAKAKGSAANNQSSFAAAIRSVNMQLDTLAADSVTDLTEYNMLIVPYDRVERLTNRDYDRITQFVGNGGRLMTDGKNSLAEEMGIKFATSNLKIERLRDQLYPEDVMSLKDPEIMGRFEVNRDDDILCLDERTEAPVVVSRQYGDGKFIYLGIRFDPITSQGYSRFPYLLEYVRKYFHLQPILRREHLEMYFDPGFRRNISVEDLVKRWVTDGVRTIHVAGWHQYPTWTYDYDRLLRLCHANGILVYLWLEPPHVSQKFWKDHPEWQEVNYKGEPVPQLWRYLMALTDSACLQKVKSTYSDLLLGHDWDGVNLAELYFESQSGVQTPRLYTPMHPSARKDFRRKAGFDPALLFDSTSAYFWKRNAWALRKYEDYRVDVLIRLHEEFLSMIDSVKIQKPHLQTIVTAMDNIGTPVLRADFGVDVQRIMALGRKHEFRIQVEDPQSEWSRDPGRYLPMAERYRAVAPNPDDVMVDLNILQFRSENKPSDFPTLIQTGVESYELVRSAALGTLHYTIYSESSVRPQDLRMLSYAASARAEITRIPGGWQISAPHPVVLRLPQEYAELLMDDGIHIYPTDGSFLLPAGLHQVKSIREAAGPFSGQPVGGNLLSISGRLLALETSNRSVTLRYASAGRCAATFSHRPIAVLIDGKETTLEISQGQRRFGLLLPPGEHDVTAVLESTVTYGIDITSFWSSWLIVGFGFLAGSALFLLYLLVRLSRPSEVAV